MLHDLIMALSGHPGDVFQVDIEGNLKVRKEIAFPFVHPGETAVIDDMLEVGTMYLRLKNFVHDYQLNGVIEKKGTKKHQGLYVAALCNGIEEIMEDYEDALADFELRVIQDVHTTISNLRAGLEQYRFLFDSLLSIMDEVLGGPKSSTLVVEIVKTEYDHKLHLQDQLRKLIPWINRTLYKQITSWIVCGAVADPFQECFIQKNLKKKEGESVGESQEFHYNINYSVVPSHFSVQLMEKILFIGNAILILQKSERTKAVAIEQQKLFHDKMRGVPVDTFRPEALTRTVQELAVSIGKILHKLVVVDANLVSHLGIVKDFYLTGRGELFHDFLESAKHVPLIKNTLQSDFRRAFSTSAVRVQVQDDVMQKIELHVSAADSATCLVDHIGKLSLRIKHDWPLQVFFTEEVELKYNQLLRFLLKVRLLQMDLNQIWVDTKKVFRFPISGGPAELKNVMSFFIDHLQHYLQEDVLENQFTILMDAVDKSTTFEDIRIAHGNFQSAILAQSFQTNKRVNHFVEELLSIGYKFTKFMRNHIEICEQKDMPINEGISDEIKELSENFRLSMELLLNLLKTMACNPQTGTHLGQFLLRVDFNSYFSSLMGDPVSNPLP